MAEVTTEQNSHISSKVSVWTRILMVVSILLVTIISVLTLLSLVDLSDRLSVVENSLATSQQEALKEPLPEIQNMQVSNKPATNYDGSNIIIGNYIEYVEDWSGMIDGDTTKFTCSELEITDGDQLLLQEYKRRIVEDRNSINALTQNGNVRVSLDPKTISTTTMMAIKSATPDSPVSLRVLHKPSVGVGAGPCFSEYQTVELVQQ